MDAKKERYTGNSGEKDAEGNNGTQASSSCSSYIVHLVWIKEFLLADIIGTDGLDEKNAERTLTIL
jgi:hypothetical protein